MFIAYVQTVQCKNWYLVVVSLHVSLYHQSKLVVAVILQRGKQKHFLFPLFRKKLTRQHAVETEQCRQRKLKWPQKTDMTLLRKHGLMSKKLKKINKWKNLESISVFCFCLQVTSIVRDISQGTSGKTEPPNPSLHLLSVSVVLTLSLLKDTCSIYCVFIL